MVRGDQQPVRRRAGSAERKRPIPTEIIRTSGGFTDGEQLLQEVYKGYSDRDTSAEARRLDSFSHVSRAERARDEAFEARLREKFSQTPKSGRGEVMERFLEHEILASDWFDGAYVSQTTDFDDFRGTDLVLEWEPEEEGGFVPRVAVDITSSDQHSDVARKKDKLKKGAEVKYFRSEVEDDAEMQLKKLPIVILGIDASLLPSLGAVAERQKTRRGTGRDQKVSIDKRAFAEHPIRLLIVEQARIQLDTQVARTAALIARSLLSSRDKEIRTALDTYRQSEGDADAAAETIGQIPSEKLPGSADDVAYWLNMLGAKRIIDAQAEQLLEELEKNPAEFEAVRTWLSASETHRQITSLGAGE